ncbi:MAG: YkgJ family cysteine cluster protein [Candidatus Thorarchaeota archaeon]
MASEDTGIHFECLQCGACCKQVDMIVTVTSRDIARLSIGLGLTAKELLKALDFYVLPEGQTIPDGLRQIPQVKTEQGRAYVALKKLEDGSCVFLDNNLCLIHPIRPAVCASFPFVFRAENNELVWSVHAKQEICPGLKEGPAILHSDLLDLSREPLTDFGHFQEVAKKWNTEDKEHTALGYVETVLSESLS